jgi:hypothetical protein
MGDQFFFSESPVGDHINTVESSLRFPRPREQIFNGFSVGGRISQSNSPDNIPYTAYDTRNPVVINITIINSAYFTALTGLPPPPTPINAATYTAKDLPWFSEYEEIAPIDGDDDRDIEQKGILSTVLSVSELIKARIESNDDSEDSHRLYGGCQTCSYAMATFSLHPCGHKVCATCFNPDSTPMTCPSQACRQGVMEQKTTAAPMGIRGAEDYLVADESNIFKTTTSRDPAWVIETLEKQKQTSKPIRTLSFDSKESKDGVSSASLGGTSPAGNFEQAPVSSCSICP